MTGLGSPIANVLVPDLVSFAALSLSQSSLSVGESSILPGDTTTVTLTAKEADGSQEASGGLHVAFSLAAGSTGSGTFGPVVDNGNGTYSATFTGTTAGSLSLAATIDGYAVTSAPPALIVLPPAVTAVSTTEMAGVYPAGTVIPVILTFNEAGDGQRNAAVGAECGRRRNRQLQRRQRHFRAHLQLHRRDGTKHLRSGLCLDRGLGPQRRQHPGCQRQRRRAEPAGHRSGRPGNRGHRGRYPGPGSDGRCSWKTA